MCKISHIFNGGAGSAAVLWAKQKEMYSERTRLIVRRQLQEFDPKLNCTRTVTDRVTKGNELTPKRAARFRGPQCAKVNLCHFEVVHVTLAVAMWISTELGAEFNKVFSGFLHNTTATCLRSVTIVKMPAQFSRGLN